MEIEARRKQKRNKNVDVDFAAELAHLVRNGKGVHWTSEGEGRPLFYHSKMETQQKHINIFTQKKRDEVSKSCNVRRRYPWIPIHRLLHSSLHFTTEKRKR